MRVVLTVADHDRNGFVSLAQWSGLTEDLARRFIQVADAAVADEAEPDIETSPFTFILDLWDGPHDNLVDTGKRNLPTQLAMSLAPEQVQEWLTARPDPNSVAFDAIPELPQISAWVLS